MIKQSNLWIPWKRTTRTAVYCHGYPEKAGSWYLYRTFSTIFANRNKIIAHRCQACPCLIRQPLPGFEVD